jgi:repressor LexA
MEAGTTTERQPLTPRQQDIRDWIAGYIDVHGYSPTVKEIANHYGWRTPNSAKCHLNPMRKKGYITWQDGCSRTLRVIGGDA